jgi:hypothetical protein
MLQANSGVEQLYQFAEPPDIVSILVPTTMALHISPFTGKVESDPDGTINGAILIPGGAVYMDAPWPTQTVNFYYTNAPTPTLVGDVDFYIVGWIQAGS